MARFKNVPYLVRPFWFAVGIGLCLQLSFGALADAAPADEPVEGDAVAFNFVDVELPAVVEFISKVTGKNFIFDESLKGKVTIVAPSKLKRDDAFRLFSAILELKGYTLLPSGVNAYKIVHQAKAKQGTTPLETKPPRGIPDESFVARLIPLNYISARDAQNFLKPLISKTGHLSFFGPGNVLLAVDSHLNLKKLQEIIDAIDRPSRTPGFELVPLKHANAANVADVVTRAFSKSPGQAAAKAPVGASEDTVSVVSDERLNAVILIGDNNARKKQIRELITLLDQPLSKTSGRTKVYFLRYADADEVAKVLKGLTTGAASATQPKGRVAPPGARTPAFAGSVTIMPHKTTNALVITAAPSDYASLVGVIEQLDRRRPQVFVEAVIAEVSINKIQELGTQWRAALKANDSPVAIGGFGTVDTGTITNIITGLEGLSFGGVGDFFRTTITGPDGESTTFNIPGFAAIVSIDELKDAVNVLSAPRILTSDNQEASIHVGENVPFISKQDTTSAGITSNVVERTDVGIQLKVTPQISEGDYITLDVYQETSAVLGGESDAILTSVGPTIRKRSAQTSIVLKDGETVVIGGLMREDQGEIVRKVPLLGDIPLLGWLFKFRQKTREKVNLLISLTPHIVREHATLRTISDEKQAEFRSLSEPAEDKKAENEAGPPKTESP